MESPQDLTAGTDPQLMPRLPAGVLAQFEAVSGLLVVNVTRAEIAAAARALSSPDEASRQLFAAINHEMYHYFQVIATGYHFLHVAEMGETAVLAAARMFARQDQPRRIWRRRSGPGRRRKEARERIAGWETVLHERDYLAQLQATARPGDTSLANAQEPELMAALDQHHAQLGTPNGAGLSALDLIEGSALVYQYALTYSDTQWNERMSAEWSRWGMSYRRAFDIASEQCGPRALQVFLPAVALALRYEMPPEAYPDLLQSIAAEPPGSELATARALAARRYKIPHAGRYLGTSSDVRRQLATGGRWNGYDSVLDELSARAWGVDELDLLAVPEASGRVPSFPLGIITSDGPLNGPSDDADLRQRIRLSSIMLRTASLPRAQFNADKRALTHILRARHLVMPPSLAGRTFYEGVRRQEQGDISGACKAFRTAMDAEEPDLAARAAYNLGILLMQNHDASGARTALERAASSADLDVSAQAAFNLGVLLTEGGDVPAAITAYRLAMASGHTEQAPRAADNLGILLYQQADVEGAREAFQQAIDSGHEYFTRSALVNLGRMLEEIDDRAGAQTAWERVTKSRHPEMAPRAGLNLGLMLSKTGDVNGACSALRKAISSHHPDVAPKAEFVLGDILEKQGDVEAAREAYQHASDSGHEAVAVAAALRLEALA